MTSKFLPIGLVLLILLGCSSSITDEDWIVSQPKPWLLSGDELSLILPQFQNRFPKYEDRLRALALWRVGTPYEIFKLGEEVAPDTDPIFRLDVSDCTGHVLTSLALAQSSSWDEAHTNMIAIHYKADNEGIKSPTYKSRWHYTTDRLMGHPSTENISEELVGEVASTASITLNRKSDGSEFLDLDWARDVEAKYIPNDYITADLLARLPKIVGVAFVKPSWFKMGLVVGHEGMIIDGQDLLHAGQEAGETVRQPFLDYYFRENGPIFGGIMIYRFNPLTGEDSS